MSFLARLTLALLFISAFATPLLAQRHTDLLEGEDRLGVTTMMYYTYQDWSETLKNKGGEFRFDSFRLWAQTELTDHFNASAQYRLYDGWQTPHHLWVGYQYATSNLKLGQTWVPFGIHYAPYDDWGNIPYYVGLEDDYDYGLTWEYMPESPIQLNLGFFKNQQLASDSRMRYDTDIFSGSPGSDDIIANRKANEETNQLNARFAWTVPVGDGDLELALSGLWGQIYNQETTDFGTRQAYAAHANLSSGPWHAFLQGTTYDYTQKLPESAGPAANDWLNVASWNFAYEIPRKANLLSTGAAYDLNGEKLTIHANYSRLSGGTAEADSWLWTGGLRSFWENVDVFLEAYYGRNDPQLSGEASGYGRDADQTDFRIDLRFFYRLSLVKAKQQPRPSWR